MRLFSSFVLNPRWKEETGVLKKMFEATVGQLEADNKHLSKRNKELAAQLSSQEELGTTVRVTWFVH